MSDNSFTVNGVRYKEHVVYLERDSNESNNSYIVRLWFVVKNISKVSYEQLVSYSRYFVNIKQKQLKYNDRIHENLQSMFEI